MDGSSSLGLYIHVPFCRARCSYCAFYTVPHDTTAAARYEDALLTEIEQLADRGRPGNGIDLPPQRGRHVDTIYLGGGTPSLLPASSLERILAAIRRFFAVDSAVEITLEANPETVSRAAAEAWIERGISRVSVGAQTFSDDTLRRLGRQHDAVAIITAVERLRDAGCRNVNLDLIAGVDAARLTQDVDAACALQPEHLSLYLLEVEEDDLGTLTPLARRVAAGRAAVPSSDWYAEAYPEAVARLSAAGLQRYEICNFARGGAVSRHNLKYWHCDEVVGFGPSAHSLAAGVRFANPPDTAAWERSLLSERRLPEAEVDDRTAATARAEIAILALRLTEGIGRRRLERLLATQHRPDIPPFLDDLADNGFLQTAGERVAFSTRGMLISNEIFQRLLP